MSTEWTNLREVEATVEVGLAGSTRSAGKPRTRGRSEADRDRSRETSPAHAEVRRRVSTQLAQIAKKAKSDRKLRFTSLAHLLTPEFLTETWRQMNRRGASGVDGETTKEFEQGLDTRVQELRRLRLKRGSYRAPPVRRVEIPKGPGKAGTSRSEFRRSKIACCKERSRGYWKRCSRRISWNARMDFGPDVIPMVPYGRYAGSSSRRRLDIRSRLISAATLTTSSMDGCRRWLLIGLQTRSSCA